MAFGDFVKSQFIDVIEHVDENSKLLVYKYERYKDEIKQDRPSSFPLQSLSVDLCIHCLRLSAEVGHIVAEERQL